MKHPVSIIGLGVMGQRMLTNMHKYAGFAPVVAWDPDEGACRRTAEQYPRLEIAADAAAAIEHPATRVVYIASPPRSHEAHALAAIAAGKAVYCEKPLGVDVAASRRMTETAEASAAVDIVNFSLASAAATTEIERRLARGEAGELAGVDIRLHFSQWPRAWQMDAAGWLSRRAEGGFTREVLSHWIYLTQRLFGALTLHRASARYPGGDAAETHLVARLEADGLPVSVAGSVGGSGPDLVEYTIWGSRTSLRVFDWNRLFSSTGGEWQAELTHIADAREAGYELQLAHAARAVAGETHTMPGFADALAVQVLIEAMLET
ncbi:MAG: Gfo/Idh/MocA family oxidoreductase [Gammaproteobacteria bacterium]|nr:Gfo/Idh/MocA family oxidoreductase [Gammaproteobacteria bacterium]